ncbi:hypothetical protein ACFPZP_16190 [Citrobacter bitternis]|uniref:Uncharacterized protein n=1 Tax=Citrobacter bitternis TaxID=1585982 RepID=A0ABW1Q132_9ENTR
MRDTLLEYAYRRIVELEKLLLVDVAETVWPAEVRLVYSQIERAGELPAHHINHMWPVVTRKLLNTTVGQVSGKIKSV